MQQSYRYTNPLVHYGILAFIVAVGILTLASHTVLHAFSGSEHTHSVAHEHKEDHCHEPPTQSHTITFTKSGVSPEQLIIDRCDMVVVKNELSMEMIPAIGPHPAHIHYAGFEENILKPGDTYSFRATTAGSFSLHNHENDTQAMWLTVR
jgi:hypothetical protein